MLQIEILKKIKSFWLYKNHQLSQLSKLHISLTELNFKDFTMKMVKMNLFYERLPSNIILVENIKRFFFLGWV